VCVVCTIHQPSAAVYADFDRVMLLSSGRVAFQGPAASADPVGLIAAAAAAVVRRAATALVGLVVLAAAALVGLVAVAVGRGALAAAVGL
jgi:hypothetical protein